MMVDGIRSVERIVSYLRDEVWCLVELLRCREGDPLDVVTVANMFPWFVDTIIYRC